MIILQNMTGQEITLTALGPMGTEMHIQMPVNDVPFSSFFHSKNNHLFSRRGAWTLMKKLWFPKALIPAKSLRFKLNSSIILQLFRRSIVICLCQVDVGGKTFEVTAPEPGERIDLPTVEEMVRIHFDGAGW